MRTLGIEFCDEGFVAAETDESTNRILELESSGAESPGFVYYDGRRYICGRQAQKRSRIYPRFVTDRCWDQLSLRLSELNVPRGKSPRYSELAYYHLNMVWERIQAGQPVDKVVFALPGNFLAEDDGDEEKIGLILGIADDLKIPLAGIVDMACASLAADMARLGIKEKLVFHLDVHQHSTFLSILEVGSSVRRSRLATAPIGFHHIFADLNPKLANSFLSQTAFDVTHNAETEQQFYDQVQNLLELFREQEEATIEMESLKRARKLSVYRDTAAKHLESINESLTNMVEKALKETGFARRNTEIPFVFSQRAAKIPGLAEKIASMSKCSISVAEAGSAALGAALFGKDAPVFEDLAEAEITTSIELGELGLPPVATAEIAEPPKQQISAPTGEEGPAAPISTHIVCKGIGHPIGSSGYRFGESPRHISLKRLQNGNLQIENPGHLNVLLNGQPANNGEVLKPGDVLTLDGGREPLDWLLIHCND